MKANRKFINEEEAVSPVIAVILMVAITVVLAATVFVLVNDLGKNVGTTGPSLGLVSDAAGSSTSKWTVKLSSATKLADVTDYRFVLATPSNGTMVFTPSQTDFKSGYDMYVLRGPGGQARADGTDTAPANQTAWRGYTIQFLDVDGNDKFSVGDTVMVRYDSSLNAQTYTSTFPAGEYTLEILHTPSGSSAGSLPRTF